MKFDLKFDALVFQFFRCKSLEVVVLVDYGEFDVVKFDVFFSLLERCHCEVDCFSFVQSLFPVLL
jgi:hypothetical protein